MGKPRFRFPAWAWLMLGAAAAGLLTLAAGQVAKEISLQPEQLSLVNRVSLDWSPTDGTVKAGRADPQFELDLPWWARPVSKLTLAIEPIWGNVGTVQFYYRTPDPEQRFFVGEQRVDVPIKIYGGVHPVEAVFPGLVGHVRIDPPDGAQFYLRSVKVTAYPGRDPAVRLTGWLVAGALLFAAAAVRTAGFWTRLWQRRRDVSVPVAGIVLVLMLGVRLWLTWGQPLKAVGGAIHDDQLFVDQALSILDGRWLGDYNHLTLIKGQGFPVWIALLSLLGIPLVLGLHGIYAAAVALTYWAWRPVFSRAAGLLVTGLALFNPASFHGDDTARVLRNYFCASLAVLTFAAASGWFLRLRGSTRQQLGWAIGTGLGFTALWLTREESIWMSGVLVMFALAGLWSVRGELRAAAKRTLPALGVPVLIWAGGVTTVCALNYHYYKIWCTVEFRAAPYCDAYAALTRIQVGPWRQFVPVSREMREAAYTVSPTFTKVQPYFEGELGEGWASMAESTTHLPPSERQIHGAGFMWALRDAAAAHGEHLSAPRAMAFYRAVADEINRACDEGKIPALPRRSGFVPPWRPEFTEQIPGQYFEAWKFVSTFVFVVPRPPPSTGEDARVAEFRQVSGSVLSPRLEDPPLPADYKQSQAFKNGVMKDIVRVYAGTVPIALLIGVGLWAWLWVRVWRGRASFDAAVLATTALAGAAAITLVVTLVHVTSFVAITIGYLSSAYPLMLLFLGLVAVAWTVPANVRRG